jgi:hypothetical protein
MAKLDHLPWLLAGLLGLAAGGAPAAEPAEPAAEPGPGKTELKIELAPPKTPAPAPAQAPAAKTPAPAAPAPAAPQAGKPAVVEFSGAPASEVLAFVGEYAGVNIITDPACAEKLKTPLTLRIKGMTCRQVLDWATRLSGTAWTLEGGAVFVTAPDKLPKPPDVAELVRKVIVDNPNVMPEPAKFEPPPEMGLPAKTPTTK